MNGPHEKYLLKSFLGSSHWWALGRCQQEPTSRKVLDIGIGNGLLGKSLLDMGFSKPCGVEPDQTARIHSADIYAQIVPELNALGTQKFDLILLLDVLEHTPNPEKFLEQALTFANDGAVILISVPNIAHWSVRIPMLFGHFRYTQRGILDQTHLQFFTTARLKSLTSRPSLETLEISASIVPLELLLPKWLCDNLIYKCLAKSRLALAKILPGLFAYQLLAAVRFNAK